MGCCKSKLDSSLNKSEYRLDALIDYSSLKRVPCALEPEEADSEGFLSAQLFHNLFYNGFYVPFIQSAQYMLVVDCRSKAEYDKKRVLTAIWRDNLDQISKPLVEYTYIVLYDELSRNEGSVSHNLARVFASLKSQQVTPLCVRGGINCLAVRYPHMLTARPLTSGDPAADLPITWFPSWVTDNVLMGRADQAHNPVIVDSMRVTHVVNLLPDSITSSDKLSKMSSGSHLSCLKHKSKLSQETAETGGWRVFDHVKYLHVPLADNNHQDILESLSRIFDFIAEAVKDGGRVLIHGDQGVDRTAAIVTAYLMASCSCSLETAYRRLSSLRASLHISRHLLHQLSSYEALVFGAKLTNIDDLEF